MSDYHKNGKYGFERNITILTMQVERLERELKDARERNQVKDKYWHNIGVERNTLKERVEELETELYFCYRNKRVGEVVDERTKVETR
jgi:ABC-type phosphate transport system auxiliary subunit